jgi:integrase
MNTEINMSDNYRRDTIDTLCRLCEFNHNNKTFEDITRDELLVFLDSYRKPEQIDPLHKWVGTYNLYRIHLLRFFRWLYSPQVEQTKRPIPAVVENIPRLKRKEISIYKPTDMWTPADDLLFLKYCPNKRDRCYHAVSRDLSCRPHEILKLKIKDVVFKTIRTSQYAEVVVNGKTGTRPIPLINSLPYLKDWIDDHPQRTNPNAYLFCGLKKNFGRALTRSALYSVYMHYREEMFPRLLQDTSVPTADKETIKELLKKPWNPYIQRHNSLTEKAKILRESLLRVHAGWGQNSKMPQIYLHYYGNESSESLLEAAGIITKALKVDPLKPKQCPNCMEPNKPDSKFCAKCRMVLTYDAYEETIDKEEEKGDAIALLADQVSKLMSEVQELKNRS